MTRHALLMAEQAVVVVVGFPPPVLMARIYKGVRARDQLINYIERNQFIARVLWHTCKKKPEVMHAY